MDTIRTTITLPVDLHEELRLRALKEKKSLGELIVEKIKGRKKKAKKENIDEQIKKSLKLFMSAAKYSVEYDAEKAVREERDRDNA